MGFWGHNFGSRQARRSSKGCINAGDHLVFTNSLSQNFGPWDWRPGPVKVGQKNENAPTLRASPRRTPHPNQKLFLNRTKKSSRICRGFEQLSSYCGWRVITKKPRANILARVGVKAQTRHIENEIAHLCRKVAGAKSVETVRVVWLTVQYCDKSICAKFACCLCCLVFKDCNGGVWRTVGRISFFCSELRPSHTEEPAQPQHKSQVGELNRPGRAAASSCQASCAHASHHCVETCEGLTIKSFRRASISIGLRGICFLLSCFYDDSNLLISVFK